MTQDTELEEWEIMNYCYDLWLNIDKDLCLSRLADTVVNNWGEIKSGETTKNEIIEEILNI